ncbi:hypothetical protein Y032_0378g307 [Ancylostoma ceylanicum]|uniref:Uncharacterized protein n=1 Tax=Ancylostoma ceylanicum TaxID=53326 RepID=A0A016RU72_9BILA|nr:hypothetical protein Y032_0378g307 [Ancylostoma ceylanicum]
MILTIVQIVCHNVYCILTSHPSPAEIGLTKALSAESPLNKELTKKRSSFTDQDIVSNEASRQHHTTTSAHCSGAIDPCRYSQPKISSMCQISLRYGMRSQGDDFPFILGFNYFLALNLIWMQIPRKESFLIGLAYPSAR